MNSSELINKEYEQLKVLGDILGLLDNLDLAEIEGVTSGSRLGSVIDLLGNVKTTLSDTNYQPKITEKLVTQEKIEEPVAVESKPPAKTPAKAATKSATKSASKAQKKSSSKSKPAAKATAKAAAKPAAKTSAKASANLEKNQAAVKEALLDTDFFPDRKSIVTFFQDSFSIKYPLKKESKQYLIGRLIKLLIDKKVQLTKIADALSKRTNGKYGTQLAK
ncbi:MAG: hypothetical protein F6K24_48340 [Okeania sp. SIO2D1]|nr:hypothetical protein [Okeania sp. SIO2D1]